MLGYFKKLGLVYNEGDNTLTIPTFRQDLGCMADLAEEVARFYGYDNIPVSLPKGEATVGKKPFNQRVDDVAREICERNGFSGGMTYSFESPKVFDKLLLPEDAVERQAIVIANPLGEDFSIMRTISLNGMLTSLATNYNRRNKSARLYELGNIYLPKELPLTELPEEKMRLTLGMYGEGDFFTMKGVVEEILEKLGITGAECEPENSIPYLHPGRQARIVKGKLNLGIIGQIHPEVGDNYNLKTDAYVAVLNMEVLTMLASFDRKYEGIAKYPASTRDLSMVMDKSLFVGQIEHVIKKHAGKILESCELFDVYEGEQVGEGKKSVAFSLIFRAKDRNLESAEVDKAVEKVLDALKEMGIELRA
jgi:phenylalanyl-tRNA synthetase beta chain